jgi:hypothetical protein
MIMRRRKKLRKNVSKYLFILTLQRFFLTTTHGADHYDTFESDKDL